MKYKKSKVSYVKIERSNIEMTKNLKLTDVDGIDRIESREAKNN